MTERKRLPGHWGAKNVDERKTPLFRAKDWTKNQELNKAWKKKKEYFFWAKFIFFWSLGSRVLGVTPQTKCSWKRSQYPAPSPMEPQENREDQVACCARHVASTGQTSSQDRFFPQPKSDPPGGELFRPFAKIFSGLFLLQDAAGIYFQIVFGFIVGRGLKWYCWCTKIPAQKTLLKYTALRQFEIKYEAFFWWKYHFIL